MPPKCNAGRIHSYSRMEVAKSVKKFRKARKSLSPRDGRSVNNKKRSCLDLLFSKTKSTESVDPKSLSTIQNKESQGKIKSEMKSTVKSRSLLPSVDHKDNTLESNAENMLSDSRMEVAKSSKNLRNSRKSLSSSDGKDLNYKKGLCLDLLSSKTKSTESIDSKSLSTIQNKKALRKRKFDIKSTAKSISLLPSVNHEDIPLETGAENMYSDSSRKVAKAVRNVRKARKSLSPGDGKYLINKKGSCLDLLLSKTISTESVDSQYLSTIPNKESLKRNKFETKSNAKSSSLLHSVNHKEVPIESDSKNIISDSRREPLKSAKPLRKASRSLSPRDRKYLNDKKGSCLDIMLSKTKSTEPVDSQCLSSIPNKESFRRKSETKYAAKRLSISHNEESSKTSKRTGTPLHSRGRKGFSMKRRTNLDLLLSISKNVDSNCLNLNSQDSERRFVTASAKRSLSSSVDREKTVVESNADSAAADFRGEVTKYFETSEKSDKLLSTRERDDSCNIKKACVHIQKSTKRLNSSSSVESRRRTRSVAETSRNRSLLPLVKPEKLFPESDAENKLSYSSNGPTNNSKKVKRPRTSQKSKEYFNNKSKSRSSSVNKPLESSSVDQHFTSHQTSIVCNNTNIVTDFKSHIGSDTDSTVAFPVNCMGKFENNSKNIPSFVTKADKKSKGTKRRRRKTITNAVPYRIRTRSSTKSLNSDVPVISTKRELPMEDNILKMDFCPSLHNVKVTVKKTVRSPSVDLTFDSFFTESTAVNKKSVEKTQTKEDRKSPAFDSYESTIKPKVLVSSTPCSNEEIIKNKPKKNIRIKEKLNSSTFDSSINTALKSQKRNLPPSTESKNLDDTSVKTRSSKMPRLCSKRKEDCSDKPKVTHSDSDPPYTSEIVNNVVNQKSSIFYSPTQASVEPKFYSQHSLNTAKVSEVHCKMKEKDSEKSSKEVGNKGNQKYSMFDFLTVPQSKAGKISSYVELRHYGRESMKTMSNKVNEVSVKRKEETVRLKPEKENRNIITQKYLAFDSSTEATVNCKISRKTSQPKPYLQQHCVKTSNEVPKMSCKIKKDFDRLNLSASVSDSPLSGKKSIKDKPVKEVGNNKANQMPSSTLDSSTEATLHSTTRKRSPLTEQRSYSPNPATAISFKRKEEYSYKPKRAHSLFDSPLSDSESIRSKHDKRVSTAVNQKSSKFDDSNETTLCCTTRNMPDFVEPTSCLQHFVNTNEIAKGSCKSGRERENSGKLKISDFFLHSPCTKDETAKSKADKKNIGDFNKKTLTVDSPTKATLEYKKRKRNASEKHRSHSHHSVKTMLKGVPQLPHKMDEQTDQDTSNFEANPFDSEVLNGPFSQFTPTRQIQYPNTGQASFPFLNPVHNSLNFGNAFPQLPHYTNQMPFLNFNQPTIQSQNAYQTQNLYGNAPPFNYFPVPDAYITYPIYQNAPCLQPYKVSYPTPSNTDFSFPARAKTSNAVQYIPNGPTFSNTIQGNGEVPEFNNFENSYPTLPTQNYVHLTNVVNQNPSGMKSFEDLTKKVEGIRKKSFIDTCSFNKEYFSRNPALLQMTVKQFYSNPSLLNALRPNICEINPYFSLPHKVQSEYVFEDDFYESHVQQVIKDYVRFYLRVLYKEPAPKDHFVKLAYSKLVFRDCMYITDAFPEENETLNLKDMMLYLCSAALLAILDECVVRNLVNLS